MAVAKSKKPKPSKPASNANKAPASVKAKEIATSASSDGSSSPRKSSDVEMFAKEYWTGDSRDGVLVNGDGYHFYRMTEAGQILEAYEYYETEDGREFACPLPEMQSIHWFKDLGFEDFEALDVVKEYDFQRIKDIAKGIARE
jgi:hypothetical protein